MKEALITLGFLCAVGIGCVVLYWAVKEDAVTPVPEAPDTIIPDYIKAVHEQSAACEELAATAHRMEATAEACMETLRECTSMLQESPLIPKRREKESE